MQYFEAQQIDKDYPEIAFYDKLKGDLVYDTVWSMSGCLPLDKAIFTDNPRKVTYTIIDRMGDSFDDVDWVTFSSVAENGTVGALWKAAEDCFQQAKENNGDWHYFIEDFDMQEDASLKLITGS